MKPRAWICRSRSPRRDASVTNSAIVSGGGGASGVIGPQGPVISNGSCSINLAASSIAPVSNNPDALLLSLNLTFAEQSMVGSHEVYSSGANAEAGSFGDREFRGQWSGPRR